MPHHYGERASRPRVDRRKIDDEKKRRSLRDRLLDPAPADVTDVYPVEGLPAPPPRSSIKLEDIRTMAGGLSEVLQQVMDPMGKGVTAVAEQFAASGKTPGEFWGDVARGTFTLGEPEEVIPMFEIMESVVEPVGSLQAGRDAVRDFRAGRTGWAVFNAASIIPVIGIPLRWINRGARTARIMASLADAVKAGDMPLDYALKQARKLKGGDDLATQLEHFVGVGGSAQDVEDLLTIRRAIDEERPLTRSEFLDVEVTADADAIEAGGAVGYPSADRAPAEAFTVGEKTYKIRRGTSAYGTPADGQPQYNVYDGDQLVASYDGDYISVEPGWRNQGIAEELMFDFRSRYPRFDVTISRTQTANRIAQRVADRMDAGEIPQVSSHAPNPRKSEIILEHRTRADLRALQEPKGRGFEAPSPEFEVRPEMEGARSGIGGDELKRKEAYKDSWVPRSYFNVEGSTPEARLIGRPVYEGSVGAESIYDWTGDPAQIKKAAERIAADRGMPGEWANIQEQIIQGMGFEGYQVEGVIAKFTGTPVRPVRGVERVVRLEGIGPVPAVRPVDEAIVASHTQWDGSTFNPRTGANMGESQKWAVSPYKAREKRLPANEPPTAQQIAEYRMAHSDMLAHDENFIGTWVDSDTGEHILDVTQLTDDHDLAVRLAQDADQDAITFLNGDDFPTENIEPLTDVGERARLRADLDDEIPARTARRVEEFRGALTPTELKRWEKLPAARRQEALRIYSLMPTPREGASVAMLGAANRGWYETSGQALKATFGNDAPRFTALLASMSPQVSVERDMLFALEMWKRWDAAGRPTDVERIRDMIPPGPSYTTVSNNVVQSLTVPDIDLLNPNVLDQGGLLSGMKVDAFYANLLGETQRVTIDTHMTRLGVTEAKQVGVTKNIAMSAATRRVADDIFEQTGIRYTPREIQEMQWSTLKEAVGGTPNAGSVEGNLFGAPRRVGNMAREVPEDVAQIIENVFVPEFGHGHVLDSVVPAAEAIAAGDVEALRAALPKLKTDFADELSRLGFDDVDELGRAVDEFDINAEQIVADNVPVSFVDPIEALRFRTEQTVAFGSVFTNPEIASLLQDIGLEPPPIFRPQGTPELKDPTAFVREQDIRSMAQRMDVARESERARKAWVKEHGGSQVGFKGSPGDKFFFELAAPVAGAGLARGLFDKYRDDEGRPDLFGSFLSQ